MAGVKASQLKQKKAYGSDLMNQKEKCSGHERQDAMYVDCFFLCRKEDNFLFCARVIFYYDQISTSLDFMVTRIENSTW